MTTKRNLFKLAEPTDKIVKFFSVLKKIKDLFHEFCVIQYSSKLISPPVQIIPPLE